MNICALVVWYNPEKLGEQTAIKNILSYSTFVKTVYIVDNSGVNNETLSVKVPNAIYIPLMENKGIAAALNVGIERASVDGFDWCLTMDQDSSWESDEIIRYFQAAKTEQSENIKSFSPSIKCPKIYPLTKRIKRKIKRKWNNLKHRMTKLRSLKRKLLGCGSEGKPKTDRWICSGNLLNISAWRVAGKFNEELFIDEVDFDLCARFAMLGFENKIVHDVSMSHKIGDVYPTIFVHSSVYFHAPMRSYFIFRNMLYMCRAYPDYTKKYHYNRHIRRIIADKLLYAPPPRIY